MALTEELHGLVRSVSDALSRHEMATLGGAPPITGHAYYDPGAIAVVATVAWLRNHGGDWTAQQLIDILAEIVDAMAAKHWAYLPGGPKHGG